MKFVSLFAGIGGLDLGLERAGMTCVGQVEFDPYCQRVLNKHWPDVPLHGDVKTFDESVWSEWGEIDLICGGYPCQPFSVAGKRRGEDDPRHLWPEFARCIRDIRPRYAILENVPGHVSKGFREVLGEVAAMGYDAEWVVFPAAALGALHRRERLFVVCTRGDLSNSQHMGSSGGSSEQGRERQEVGRSEQLGRDGEESHVADSSTRRHRPEEEEIRARRNPSELGSEHVGDPRDAGRVFTERFDPNTASWWASEPDVGRVANGIPERVDRLKGLGNAVVPQIPELIGRAILDDRGP
jgi:DNA (cytosine-5)-methyltransferase 1